MATGGALLKEGGQDVNRTWIDDKQMQMANFNMQNPLSGKINTTRF